MCFVFYRGTPGSKMLSRRPFVSATALLLVAIAITSVPIGVSGSFFNLLDKPKNASRISVSNEPAATTSLPAQKKSPTYRPTPFSTNVTNPLTRKIQLKPSTSNPRPPTTSKEDSSSNSNQRQPISAVIEIGQIKQPSFLENVPSRPFVIHQTPERTPDNNIVYHINVDNTSPLVMSPDDPNTKVYSRPLGQFPEGSLTSNYQHPLSPVVTNSNVPPPYFEESPWAIPPVYPYYSRTPWGYPAPLHPWQTTALYPNQNVYQRPWSDQFRPAYQPYGGGQQSPWPVQQQYPTDPWTRQRREVQPVYYSPMWYGPWYAPPAHWSPWVQQYGVQSSEKRGHETNPHTSRQTESVQQSVRQDAHPASPRTDPPTPTLTTESPLRINIGGQAIHGTRPLVQTAPKPQPVLRSQYPAFQQRYPSYSNYAANQRNVHQIRHGYHYPYNRRPIQYRYQ